MYWDVVIAVVASVILGSLWYGPFFGKAWMRLMGMNDKKVNGSKKKGMAASYFWMIIGTIVAVSILKLVLIGLGTRGIYNATIMGGMLWLGFAAPLQLGSVLWEGKPFGLYLINTSYQLVSIVLSAIILIVVN